MTYYVQINIEVELFLDIMLYYDIFYVQINIEVELFLDIMLYYDILCTNKHRG